MAVPHEEGLAREFLQALTLMAEGLSRVAEEMHRANLIELQRLFAEQSDRTVGDPSLADALSTLVGISEGRRRQLIFANRQYGFILLAHRIGAIDRAELLGNLKVLSMNPVFAEYWERTADHRRQLPWESLEARVGRAVDAVMAERLDDLEEWWVVNPRDESR